MLALVCITRSENFRKKSLINYNIGCLKKALQALAQPTVSSQPILVNTMDVKREFNKFREEAKKIPKL